MREMLKRVASPAAASFLLAWISAACLPGQSSNLASTAARPIVLELFTSEGCSSCPPADRLLSELVDPAHGATTKGQALIALAFHVDYWNRLGWRDRFSNHQWSERQQLYAARVTRGNVYTPQLIVQGESDCVGSDRRCIESAIAATRARAPMARLTIEPGPIAADGTLRAKVQLAVRGTPPPGARVLVVLFENGIVSRVGAGENSGRTLHHDFVVRSLIPVPDVPVHARSDTLELKLPAGSDPHEWGIAVLYQRPAGPIIAADAVWPLSRLP